MEVETQHDRLSLEKWCNYKNCEKGINQFRIYVCYEIPEVNAFY